MHKRKQNVRQPSGSSQSKSNRTAAKEPGAAPKEIAKAYEPTPDERSALDSILAGRKKSPRAKITALKGKPTLSLDHPSQRYAHAMLMKILATADIEFVSAILLQLANASVYKGEANERELNFKLSVIKGIQPKDQLETLLAAQMAVVHSLTMDMAARMTNLAMLPQFEVVGRLLNNLARTYAAQLEALKRHRSTGEQRVTVEHVTVNEGGKAIVGSLTHVGPRSEKPETVT